MHWIVGLFLLAFVLPILPIIPLHALMPFILIGAVVVLFLNK